MLIEALLGASLAIGGYQDLRTRTTAVWAWFPAVFAMGLSLGLYPGTMIPLGFVGLPAILAWRKGRLNSGDLFGFTAIAAIPTPIGFFLTFLGSSIVGLVVLSAVVLVKGPKVAKMTGFPIVTFIAIGYAFAMGFLLYLVPWLVVGHL